MTHNFAQHRTKEQEGKKLNRNFRGLHSVFPFATFVPFIESEYAKGNTRESQREVHAKGEREPEGSSRRGNARGGRDEKTEKTQ